MFKSKTVVSMAAMVVLCAVSTVDAAVITHTYSGSISSWVENPMGITPNTTVNLVVSYDDAWIGKKYDSSTSSIFNVINIIDYYNQGARLTLQIGNQSYVEMGSENPVPTSYYVDWRGSIPYMLFDNNNKPIGFSSQWLGYDPNSFACSPGCTANWDLNVGVWNSNMVDMTFHDNLKGTMGDIYASVNFSPVPLPSALLLFSSGLLGLIRVARTRRRM